MKTFFCCCLLLFNVCHSSTQELQKQLQQLLVQTHVPGLSVAIVTQDGLLWVAGMGQADVASGEPITTDTLFRIGSISKSFASLAVLHLVEQGKLSLETPVHEIAPEAWFENQWEATDPVRVVHLLEHTTGWDDAHCTEYVRQDPTIPLLEAIDYYHGSRICRWPPGTRMAYCNSGATVAAYVVEKVSGMKFEEYVHKNLFLPIGMETATYAEPTSGFATAYHSDGVTPYPYRHLILRPSVAINASVRDMVNYLLFYLNRGKGKNGQVLRSSSIDRMECPASTWAAKEGLKVGYGLSNYWSVRDGFVYHGHNGRLEGSLTKLAYMSDFGVGFVYSINSGNEEAFDKIAHLLRSFITQGLERPPIPEVAPLWEKAEDYTGWYQLDSYRFRRIQFLDYLIGKVHVHFSNGKLLVTSLGEKNAVYLPVTETQFRYAPSPTAQEDGGDLIQQFLSLIPVKKFPAWAPISEIVNFHYTPLNAPPEPIPTVALLQPKKEGTFIQLGDGLITMKRMPSWMAILQIVTTTFVCLAIAATLLYAPFWIGRSRAGTGILIWPFVATSVLLIACAIVWFSFSDFVPRLGRITPWSISLFLSTLLFAFASAAGLWALWRHRKQKICLPVRLFSIATSAALAMTAMYLAYWGVIGIRMWV